LNSGKDDENNDMLMKDNFVSEGGFNTEADVK